MENTCGVNAKPVAAVAGDYVLTVGRAVRSIESRVTDMIPEIDIMSEIDVREILISFGVGLVVTAAAAAVALVAWMIFVGIRVCGRAIMAMAARILAKKIIETPRPPMRASPVKTVALVERLDHQDDEHDSMTKAAMALVEAAIFKICPEWDAVMHGEHGLPNDREERNGKSRSTHELAKSACLDILRITGPALDISHPLLEMVLTERLHEVFPLQPARSSKSIAHNQMRARRSSVATVRA